MAKDITINNGKGTAQILNGNYSVTAISNGYDSSSITPKNVNIESGINEYSFTIAGSGTLTIHVSEDGTSTGVAIEGAKFIRTDSLGNTYGSEITTDISGNAVFNYLPYDSNNAPNIYFKQVSSDGNHEFSTLVIQTTLTSETGIYEVTNTLAATRTINLTDANYENLMIDNATISLI